MMGSYMVNDAGQRVCHRNHRMSTANIYIEKRKDGPVYEHCKTCRREAQERFKAQRPNYFIDKNKGFRKTELYKNKVRVDRMKYRRQWIEYFKLAYGSMPHCQICDRRLYWNHKQHGKRVCFDHRHGYDITINKSPRTWIQNKPCNDNNVTIWQSCDFGLLCNNCNAMLPTKNRKRYAKSLVKYLETCSL